MLLLNGSAAHAADPRALKESTRAKKPVPLDRRPVLYFSQMVDERTNIHVMPVKR